MAQFEPGQTYSTRSICDHSCIIDMEVIKRTRCTVTANVRSRGEKTMRIAVHDGVETVKPWGSYSMAPTISA